MNIGFISFFSYRPHVNNTLFLAKVAEEMGHKVFMLRCNADLEVCHNILVSKKSKIIACNMCRFGGVWGTNNSSYTIDSLSRYIKKHKVDSLIKEYDEKTVQGWGVSSLATAFRMEEESECNNIEDNIIHSQKDAMIKVFKAVESWTSERSIDLVFLFNGRMDITRAAVESLKSNNINFFSHESTWFGNGLSIIPRNYILDLNYWNWINKTFRDIPLSNEQISRAYRIIYNRFSGNSKFEWRQYHIEKQDDFLWETKKVKVLILPSSQSEFLGVESYKTSWYENNLIGFDRVIEELKKDNELDVIVKGHPIWEQRVFGQLGDSAIKKYKSWAESRGYHWTNRKDIRSRDLIAQADIVIVNGSSAAIESGFMGKLIVSTGLNIYSDAGITINVFNDDDVMELNNNIARYDRDIVIKKTLRFIYTCVYRFPYFRGSIRSISSFENKYFNKKDEWIREFDFLVNFKLKDRFKNLDLIDEEQEDKFISLLINDDERIKSYLHEDIFTSSEEINFEKKLLFKFFERIRKKLPKGDEL